MTWDVRVVLCEACDSEGRIYHGDPDTGWVEPCPYCDGTGGELIEVQPIEMDDLEFESSYRYGPVRLDMTFLAGVRPAAVKRYIDLE